MSWNSRPSLGRNLFTKHGWNAGEVKLQEKPFGRKECSAVVWQPVITGSICDFAELFKTLWQTENHLRGHSLPTLYLRMSEMIGHSGLEGKGSNVLPWHQRSLPHLPKTILSWKDNLSKPSAKSAIKSIFFFPAEMSGSSVGKRNLSSNCHLSSLALLPWVCREGSLLIRLQ